ncbi:MAG: hypothetical protein IJ123_00345 [Blautia sp.]|nr:hypothetical protein [Blautia sp.]
MKRIIMLIALGCLFSGITVQASDFSQMDAIYLSPQSMSSINYNVYHNTRFNYYVSFPNYFGQKGELPGNNDGIWLEGEGANLTISGSHNMYDSIEDLYELELSYNNDADFEKNTTDNSVSYYKRDGETEIFCYNKLGSIDCSFYLEYPAEEHDRYIDIIDYMKKTIVMP